MERISRALELARAQREARVGGMSDLSRRDNALEPTVVDHSDLHAAPRHHANEVREASASPELGDTLVFAPPVVELDQTLRERERILQPGSPGVAGAPYKMLRTQVLKRLDQLGANTLAVVSATTGAGKTLTAMNLAIAIASDSGRTALLVDFDLRNPNIHRRLGYQPIVGIEDCFTDHRPLREAMVKVRGYERLTIVCARDRVDNSSELLRSQRAADLVNEMRTRYANRVVIFDLPPVLQADDALAFSRCVQAGLLVVGEGLSRREDVARSIDLLRDLPIVGTVLNRSRDDNHIHY
jgi:protein-tyrosine kinase